MAFWEGINPVNLRCFEGVDWDALKVKKGTAWKGFLEGVEFDQEGN